MSLIATYFPFTDLRLHRVISGADHYSGQFADRTEQRVQHVKCSDQRVGHHSGGDQQRVGRSAFVARVRTQLGDRQNSNTKIVMHWLYVDFILAFLWPYFGFRCHLTAFHGFPSCAALLLPSLYCCGNQ